MNVSELVGRWYDANKRYLPWREEKNAYHIWLSEILLQQTRVAQGTPYYQSFLDRFPDIETLAAAPVEEVLLKWQGLGYYNRARLLHETARIIVRDYGAEFPKDYAAIRDLPGIGDYTAAAIASLAFDLPYAAVDGNVFRVLSRLLGIDRPVNTAKGKNAFYQAARELLDEKNPGRHNQAMIELGALICLPKNPACASCPVRSSCYACGTSKVHLLPVRKQKGTAVHRHFHYFVIVCKGRVYIRQRREKDIWALLYDFPLLESDEPIRPEMITQETAWEGIFAGTLARITSISREYRHVLSHQVLHVRFFRIEVGHPVHYQGAVAVDFTDLDQYPFPRLILKYMDDEKLLFKTMKT